jgi:DNA-binding transcriptional regulator GbsR (MarR family)
MTEMADTSKLPAAIERFILRWGDMGGQWGVNRSVAQIQALLYLAEKPMTAEEIADTLGMARSNVSTSLRELMAWKLIRRVSLLGDRRDHYEGEPDLWVILNRIVQGRKEREIDPAVAAIREVLTLAEGDKSIGKMTLARLYEMDSFVSTLDSWFGQMAAVPPATIKALVKLGSRVVTMARLGLRKGNTQPG